MLAIKQRVIELKKQYNNSQQAVTEIVKKDFQYYTIEAKTNEEIKLRAPIRNDAINKLQDIISDIPKEKDRIKTKIESVKFPNSTSDDTSKKILGESYKQSALIFLNVQHSTEEIVTEFKNCLNSKKYESAFSIYDSVLNKLPKDGIYTKPQKYLLELLSNTYNSFEGKSVIDSLENESKQIEETEEMIEAFSNQLDWNRNEVVLIYSEMTDSEKVEVQNYINSGHIPALEAIAMKNRLHEYSQTQQTGVN